MLGIDSVVRFSKLRKKRGFSKKQVADFLKADQSYLSKCENNKMKFSIGVLERAANLFACSIDCFFSESSELKQIGRKQSTKNLSIEDINAIAAINKIALNLHFMEDLLKKENIENDFGSYDNTRYTSFFYPELNNLYLSGYENLYIRKAEGKQYGAFGRYVMLVEVLKERDLISVGKYEELLLDGFRSDIVYGLDIEA